MRPSCSSPRRTRSAYTFASKWGPTDPGHVEYWEPQDAAIDASGRIWVNDDADGQLLVFDTGGVMLLKLGGPGSGDGLFFSIRKVGRFEPTFIADRVNGFSGGFLAMPFGDRNYIGKR